MCAEPLFLRARMTLRKETKMRVNWGLAIMFSLAVVVLAFSVIRNEIFPDPILTWSLRIIALFAILAMIAVCDKGN